MFIKLNLAVNIKCRMSQKRPICWIFYFNSSCKPTQRQRLLKKWIKQTERCGRQWNQKKSIKAAQNNTWVNNLEGKRTMKNHVEIFMHIEVLMPALFSWKNNRPKWNPSWKCFRILIFQTNPEAPIIWWKGRDSWII